MTFKTAEFTEKKKWGMIRKVGKVRFIDGKREMERALWVDLLTGKNYVILCGEAENISLYSFESQKDMRLKYGADYFIGRLA